MYEPITLEEMVHYFKNETELFVYNPQYVFIIGVCDKIEITKDSIMVQIDSSSIYNNSEITHKFFDLKLIGLSKNHAKALYLSNELDQITNLLEETKQRKAELERKLVKLVQGKNDE